MAALLKWWKQRCSPTQVRFIDRDGKMIPYQPTLLLATKGKISATKKHIFNFENISVLFAFCSEQFVLAQKRGFLFVLSGSKKADQISIKSSWPEWLWRIWQRVVTSSISDPRFESNHGQNLHVLYQLYYKDGNKEKKIPGNSTI